MTASSLQSSPPPPRDRLRTAGIIAAVTASIAVLDTSRFYISSNAGGRALSFLSALSSNAPSWVALGALAPFALVAARRFPLGRAGWPRALAVHLAASLLFALLHIGAMGLYIALLRGDLAALPIFLAKFSASLVINMLTYGAIVGAAHAYRFYREAQTRALAESQLRESLTEARLAALRGQLNPHFLFNTLNAISTMALKGEQDNVVRTLGYLGELLRVSLDDELPQEVPLSQELELLERYLDIQRTRFGDRLAVRQTIDEPAVLEAMVPSMLLQPLVENAIVHGVAPIPGPGEVRIDASRRGSVLVVEVSDSGVGFGTNGSSKGTGIGIANTRARLVQLYGDAHTITLGNGADGCTRVSVAIPYRVASSRRELTSASVT